MPKGRKQSPDQYGIDFGERRRSRRLLIQAVAHRRTGLRRRRWSNSKAVLLYLVNCEGEYGIFPYIASIVAATELSRSTVNREISDLKTLKILTGTRQPGHHGWIPNLG